MITMGLYRDRPVDLQCDVLNASTGWREVILLKVVFELFLVKGICTSNNALQSDESLVRVFVGWFIDYAWESIVWQLFPCL